MRVFKSKWFSRFARRNGLGDSLLKAAVLEIEAGNFDADLGGHVYKQRIAREDGGKRGGYRTIVLFKKGERAFFVYGFAKNKMENITEIDVAGFKKTAKDFMGLSNDLVHLRIENGSLIEITEEA